MSSSDGPGTGPEGSGQSNAPAEQVNAQLVEALLLLLVEKGVLTRNDLLSVVQTVAQVQQGIAEEAGQSAAHPPASILMLQRLYVSFEAIADSAAGSPPRGDNIHQLRPPAYNDVLEFPPDD